MTLIELKKQIDELLDSGTPPDTIVTTVYCGEEHGFKSADWDDIYAEEESVSDCVYNGKMAIRISV